MNFQEFVYTFVLLFTCASFIEGQKKPRVPKWKPKTRPFNGDNIIAKTDGSQIKLNCAAYGWPKPSIVWYKNNKLFDHTKRKKTKLHKSSLTLNDVTVSDKGDYKCVVTNSEGSIDFTFIVDVIRTSWPLELEEPENATVIEGGTVTFRCRSTNDPDANAQWIKRKNEDSVPSDANAKSKEQYLRSQNGILTITNVTVRDEGKYTCMVGNYVGIKSVDAWLTVIRTTTSSTTTTTTTTTTPPTTTTTTTTTTPAPTTTSTTTTSTTPAPITYPPSNTDDEDLVVEGSGGEMGKKKKKKKKKNKKRKKKKNKGKKRKNKEREREERRRERKRKQELEKQNKEQYNPFQRPDVPTFFEGGFDRDGIDKNNMKPGSETIDQYNTDLDVQGNNLDHINVGNNGKIQDPNGDIEFRETSNAAPKENAEEGMNVWTIYIIVGLVAGGVLLVGLVAIVVALCCNRIEDRNGYKHTSV